MKKVVQYGIFSVLALALVCFSFSSCGKKNGGANNANSSDLTRNFIGSQFAMSIEPDGQAFVIRSDRYTKI